jgi:ParB family chromosome partitioning protein
VTARESQPRLGRGLAALLGETETAHGARDAEFGPRPIPVEHLEPGPFQPRGPIDEETLVELADSIRARGILQPLLARPHPDSPDRFQIIAGERRWRAAQKAGLHELPVLVRALTNTEAMAAALVENLQRTDLNAIEEGDGYRRLIQEFGLTQEKLAEAVGKSRSHIANTMRLLNLPTSIQQDLRRGTLTAGHARALLAHPDPAKAALTVIARGLNVRQTEALAARSTEPTSGEPSTAKPESNLGRPDHKDPDTRALEQTLSDRLGLKIEIDTKGARGTVRIHYRGMEQLEGIVALLSQ